MISPVSVSITMAWPPLAPMLGDALEQRLLGGVLHRAVERQHDVVAGDRRRRPRCSLPAIERPPGATSSVSSPGVPLQHVVVLLLEAGDADAVDVGAPDDAAAGVAAGQHPPVLAVDVTPARSSAAIWSADRRRRPGGRRTRSRMSLGRPSLRDAARRGLLVGRGRGARRASSAVPSGSLTCLGLTAIVLAGTDSASSSPLRSKIAPRWAGSGRVRVHCSAPALRSVVALVVCSRPTLTSTTAEHERASRPAWRSAAGAGCPAPKRLSERRLGRA